MGRRRDSLLSSNPAAFLWTVPVILSGCLSGVGPSDLPLLETDASTYELVRHEYGFTVSIPYTFTNRTGGAVYLTNCGGQLRLHLEREDGGDWHSAWAPILAACQSSSIVIEEDELWVDTLEVWGGLPGCNCLPRWPPSSYVVIMQSRLC